MKRSEIIKLIHNSLNVYLEDTYKNVAMDISETILDNLEKCGMLPPHTSLENCENPELQVYVENIDVPQWIVLGWDKE